MTRQENLPFQPPLRWQLDAQNGITWPVVCDPRLPHFDHLEMSGRAVSLIAHYRVDEARTLHLERQIIWPTLRRRRDDERGYLVRRLGRETLPQILMGGESLELPPLESVRFDGLLHFVHATKNGLKIERTLFPFAGAGGAAEEWRFRNLGADSLQIRADFPIWHDSDSGVYGDYVLESCVARNGETQVLGAGETAIWGQIWSARKASEAAPQFDFDLEKSAREALVSRLRNGSLRLETPDNALNQAFSFAKLRAGESHFDTKMGLVHSPGGGNFYGGVWANDQAEYAGPFFPFLGDDTANEGALNCYRIFSKFMDDDFKALPSSLEVEGDLEWRDCGDRGDAAMIAYGASRFALALGNRETAREIDGIVQWCLEYCRRKTDKNGVIASDTDELEGRFPTGNANLSTSTLCYGGLRSGADLARALGETERAALYDARADELARAIENFFGACVEGFATYRYFEENTVLRAWICLPLTMGILERASGTLEALFSPRLWTSDGLATQAGETTFWDRATLYGLRGAFCAGATETAFAFLGSWARRRLLGDHVPYAIEAFPENAGAHLSAESALFCRIFTEGVFGITPRGLREFSCTPRLPDAWDEMHLRDVRAFGGAETGFDVSVFRCENGLRLQITRENEVVFQARGEAGTTFLVSFDTLAVAS